MKKITISCLIVLLALIIFGGIVSAAASVSASPKTVTAGEEVSVTVNFGKAVAGAQFTLNYDSNKFTYKSVSVGSFANGKYIYYSPTETEDLSSVTIKFTSKTSGSASFGVSALGMYTSASNEKNVAMSNSSVSVTVNPIPTQAPATQAPATQTPATAAPTAKPATTAPTAPTAKPVASQVPEVTTSPEVPEESPVTTESAIPTESPDTIPTESPSATSVAEKSEETVEDSGIDVIIYIVVAAILIAGIIVIVFIRKKM